MLYGLITTALLLLFGHYFAWPKRLHQLWAYVYGVAAIYIGIYIYLGPSTTFWSLCLFPIVGGAATGLSYGYDWLRNLIVRAGLDDG